MAKKFVFLAAVVAVAFAGSAFASDPPAYGGYQAGWGMNPNNWTTTTGSWASGFAIYDWGGGPNTSSGGDDWVVGYSGNTPIYITYAPITLELWIEMYSVQTYRYTSYKWHRLGNLAENVTFVIQGTIQSNNGQWISLVWDGNDAMDKLYFRHDVGNRVGPQYGSDIPITWLGRWGTDLVYGANIVQDWLSYTPSPDVDMLIPDPCDHWFEFKGSFELPYHIDDGYYSLTLAGCPAPVM